MKLVRSAKRPSRGAIHQGGDLWLVGEESLTELGAEELAGTDARDAVPPRTDLPPGHPLYGQRALRSVPAGSGDIIVSNKGDIEPVGAAVAEPIEIEVDRAR